MHSGLKSAQTLTFINSLKIRKNKKNLIFAAILVLIRNFWGVVQDQFCNNGRKTLLIFAQKFNSANKVL